MFHREDIVVFSTTSLVCFQDMFQERSRMSSAHEANTQRLMLALRDKETALKVRMPLTLGGFSTFFRSGFSFIRPPYDNYWFPSQRPLNSPHQLSWSNQISVPPWPKQYCSFCWNRPIHTKSDLNRSQLQTRNWSFSALSQIMTLHD